MLKKLKLTDYIIIAVIVILVVIGSLAVCKKKNFSNIPIEKETNINFEVFFRGVTISDRVAPFNVGDDAFITIRNVPYTKLKIVAMDGRPRMIALPANNKEGFIVTQDISTPNMYDLIVKLEDTAKKTPDGYVAGGNKIKMGIPVVIEGERYKYTGVISNVYEASEVVPEQTKTENK